MTEKSSLSRINTEAKDIAKDLKLEERIEQHSQHQSFIILKDCKDNFQSNPKCRLIKTEKSEIGVIKKHYIEEINENVRRDININQLRNTLEVKLWFNKIKNSKKNSFIKFYIVGFSPSISKDLLTNAINLASTVTTIKKNVIDTIHSRKSISFNKNEI